MDSLPREVEHEKKNQKVQKKKNIRREDLFLMKHFDKLLSRTARASLAVPPSPSRRFFPFFTPRPSSRSPKKMLMAFCLGALIRVSGGMSPECIITHPLLQSHNN